MTWWNDFYNELTKPDGIGRLLVPSLVGLVPVLINLFVNWLDKRSHIARRNAELDAVNKHITFLTGWYELNKQIKGQNKLADEKKRVARELETMSTHIAFVMAEWEIEARQEQEKLERFRKLNGFQKALLLYTPYNFSGWVYHTLYYMCLIPFMTVLGYEIYRYYRPEALSNDVSYLPAGLGLGILVILFEILGRKAAAPFEQELEVVDETTRSRKRISPTNRLRLWVSKIKRSWNRKMMPVKQE